jgi:hypothetical protein
VLTRNRRIHSRVKLRLQVQFWRNGGETFGGITRDVSAHGFYCEVEQTPTFGEHLECVLVLPLDHPIRDQSDLYIRCHTHVVRIEQLDSERYGIACCVYSYSVSGLQQARAKPLSHASGPQS